MMLFVASFISSRSPSFSITVKNQGCPFRAEGAKTAASRIA
jgi:hypothetical protein